MSDQSSKLLSFHTLEPTERCAVIFFFLRVAACSLSAPGNCFMKLLKNNRQGVKSCSAHIAGTSERVPA